MKRDFSISDPEMGLLMHREAERAATSLSLIASENEAYPAVLEPVGSFLSNKYAEGMPGKRFYAGCALVDDIEMLAVERVKKLFGAEFANVQPHSGSQANMAVYRALLKPGDTLLAMSFSAGGHLTHGYPKSFSGSFYRAVSYGVDPKTGLLNYEEIEKIAVRERPKLIVAGASSYSRIIDFERISAIAKKVDAFFMADIAHIAGLVVARIHPTPVPFADCVTSTTHKTLRGPRGAFILAKNELGENINRAIMPGIQGGPFINVIAGKAVCFHLAMNNSFIAYQHQVVANAQALARALVELGYRIVTGGTDTHLLVIDLTHNGVTGAEVECWLDAAGISSNRNAIPFDTREPWIASGLRLGTPTITARGFKESDCKVVAQLIDMVVKEKGSNAVVRTVRKQVYDLCKQFPWSYGKEW